MRVRLPYYSTKDEAKIADGVYSSLPVWTGWTLSNMGNAVSLASTDWFEQYALADTQTSVGGIFGTQTGQKMNALSGDAKNKILQILGKDLALNADVLDPEAANLDGEILTDEEREQIERVRHVSYALDTVGKVSYSQNAHANLYGNLAGHSTDCSGFVSNIWRDRFEASQTTSSLYQLASDEGALYEYHGIGTEGIEPGDIILKDPNEDGAHALLYVGTFNMTDIYGEDMLITDDDNEDSDDRKPGMERVFTIDCASMVLTINDLASQEDTPIGSIFEEEGNKLSLKDRLKAKETENKDKQKKVRGGNVRFCDRHYTNSDTPGMYYIDMAKFERVGQRQLFDDYSDLGDATRNFWETSTAISDLTQTRNEMDIEFPVPRDVVKDEVIDIEIPDEDLKEPTEDPDDPIRERKSVILQMNQYINQGSGSWAQQKRGGIASNSTIKQAGCIDCSYLMVVSYYNMIDYSVSGILTNPRYYSGNQFND